jgi:hypothetical protein
MGGLLASGRVTSAAYTYKDDAHPPLHFWTRLRIVWMRVLGFSWS